TKRLRACARTPSLSPEGPNGSSSTAASAFNRIRNAIYSALEDYVRYFESQGFQIRRDWIDEAFSAATSLKWVRGGEPKEEERLSGAGAWPASRCCTGRTGLGAPDKAHIEKGLEADQ